MLWGPKQLTSVRPVRPVAETGQTGPAQADRRCFGFAPCHVSLKLMNSINLITKDEHLGVTWPMAGADLL